MIEATCAACGTQNRIAESDVPVGAKFVTCASCKSRVPLPASAATAAGKPALPAMPKLPSVVPAIPSIKPPAAKPPAVPVGPPSIPLGPAGASAIPVPPATGGPNDIIDLSDLPAPKRQSPLGSAGETKPAPRSGLSAALDADLPAPKATPRAPVGPPPASLDLDDLLGPPGVGATSAPGVSDLPAPKPRGADLLAPKSRPATPPPVQSPQHYSGEADLPAPKRSPIAKAPAPGPLSLDLDLDLMPRDAQGVSDLPAPKPGLADLPTPVAARNQADQLQPKGAQARSVPGSGTIDLPMPKPGSNLDLPAPKGFFDDLPQPAKGQRSGNTMTDDIAPKGFFDDLPQPAKGQRSGGPTTDDVAPKGFFDDLPQPAKSQRDLPQPARGQAPGPTPTDDIAPKGFFDDLPQPALTSQAVTPAIAQPAPRTRTKQDSRGAIDLGDDPIEQIDLASEEPQELELDETPIAPPPSSGSFDDLDLSAPSAVSGRAQHEEDQRSGIKIGTPKTPPGGKPQERAALPSLTQRGGGPGADEPLELEEPRETQSISQRLGPKREKAAAPAKPPKKPINRKLVLGIVLGLAAAGGGGAYLYKRHAAEQARQDTISEELARARKALASDAPNRWTTANNAASKVLELDSSNGAAAGIAAEALFAGALADGKNLEQRFATGRKKINDALGKGITSPELDRASALGAIVTNPAGAITKLNALITKAPKDPWLALYLAWAQSAAGDNAEALKAYDIAAAAPGTKVLALLGRARIKSENADAEGAKADYNAVLAVQKDNITAQVGLAATLPASQTQQQESDLLAIIARKDFKDADPRARVLAYVLAGDAARRSNRLDAARERYRKALDIDKRALTATSSLAEVELADNKRDAAKALVEEALTMQKDHAPSLLVQADIAIAESKLDEADAMIKALEERKPPLPTLLLVRVGVMRGHLLSARKQDDAAIDAYASAAKLAGELDLTPTMAAIAKLAEMAKAAAAAKDTVREAALKARAEELLATLAGAADKDPSLAFSLGVAYFQAGAPAQAEPWLRKVIEVRPKDPDAKFQLAVVLRALDRGADAVAMLERAVAAAPDRVELSIELARTYEALGKDTEAGTLYAKLLALPDVPLELRSHAGLFYVRTGKPDKAGEQGRKITAVAKDSAVGHYLVGEGLLAANSLDQARQEFTEAVMYERSARHLDAQGRANEAISIARKDTAMQDSAIRSYDAAIQLDPTMFTSQLGLGRLYVARKEDAKAVPPLLVGNKLKPSDGDVAYYLGAAYARLGEKKVALQWLQKASGALQNADTWYLLGDIYSSADVDDPRAAANAYGAATRRAAEEAKQSDVLPPWYAEALYQYGRRSLDAGDEGAARAAWEKWMGLNPKPPANARFKEVERLMATTLKR